MSKVFTITEGLENMGALRTGGQGSVYKGRRTGTIITAVKLLPTPIHTESAEDKNFRNFQNEVEKLKKVNEEPNPNVVKILNSGITESGSFPFIEMEFIDGPDLEDLLKPPHEPIFPIKEVIKVADQLANALAHCHKLSVKHGDIKSNNVKYNVHSGNYVLLDFGLSAMTDDQRRTSIQHAGAIEFMAPEQNDGQLLLQTDIYSYGIILYELLAGQVPFPLVEQGQKSRNELMLAHMEQEVPDLMALRRKNLPESWSEQKKFHEMQVPAWLLQVIEKCLQKEPLQRFGNGVELQDFIIHNSISSVTDIAGNEWSTDLMTTEQELAKVEETETSDTIRVSRPVFYSMLVLLVVMTGTLGILLFATPETEKNPVEQVNKKADSTPQRPAEKTKGISPETATVLQTDTRAPEDIIIDSILNMKKAIKPVERPPVTKTPVDSTKLDLDTTVYF
ncbi:serine/threonine protein kinase [Pedobacter immunditicola]|uniref:serine/threonine protein kinase n=1 Tax=Pedobacter immunditicola TaxID=3133440 RepID=UPI0030B4D339